MLFCKKILRPAEGQEPIKGMVNCQNSRDKGPPECNSARG